MIDSFLTFNCESNMTQLSSLNLTLSRYASLKIYFQHFRESCVYITDRDIYAYILIFKNGALALAL